MVTNAGKTARVGGMGVPFAAYGAEIYLQGLADQRPAFPTDPSRLEAAARSVLDDGPFGYVAGGAGAGATMRANRTAFDRYGLVPRMLRDTTARDWSTTVLGRATPRAGTSCTGPPRTRSPSASWTGRGPRATASSWSRSTRGRWAGARTTSIFPTCRSCAALAPRSRS